MIMVKLKIKKGESYYMYLLGKECGGEWRVESGDGSGVAEVGMGIWRYLRYLLGWSCEMEWNGME